MNRAQKNGLFCLVIGLILIAAIFMRQYNGAILVLLVLLPLIYIIRKHDENKRENINKYDELESTILLRASRATMLTLFYLGILVYMILSHLIDASRPDESLRITSNHLDIAFFTVCAIGMLVNAIAIFIQRFYYQSPKDLYRTAIIRSAILLLFSAVVLSGAIAYWILKRTGILSYHANLFYLLPLFMLGLAFGTLKKYPIKTFTCTEKLIYKKTHIAGIIASLLFGGAVAVRIVLNYAKLNFPTLLIPTLISIWVGIFIHSILSLTMFYFLDFEKTSLVEGGSA